AGSCFAVPSCWVFVQVVCLIAAGREFSSRPDPARLTVAAAVFAVLLVVVLVLGSTVVAQNDANPDGPVIADVAYAVLQSVFGPRVTGEFLGILVPGWVDLQLGVLGSGLLLVTVWVMFRPTRARAVLTHAVELAGTLSLA